MSRYKQPLRFILFAVFVLLVQTTIRFPLELQAQESGEGLTVPVQEQADEEPMPAPVALAVQAPAGPFGVGEAITLEVIVENGSEQPMHSVQLDLPPHTAVWYTAGPGIPTEGVGSGTLTLDDVTAKNSLSVTLSLRLQGPFDGDLLKLPFQVRTAVAVPVTTIVTLPVTADAADADPSIEGAQGPGASTPTYWQFTYTPPGVSAFTGAATYGYAMPLPPGSGGLTPQLAVSYSSRGVDGLRYPVKSHGFGAGWSMPQAEIVNGSAWDMYQPNPACCSTFDNSQFTLVLNGASYQLKPDANTLPIPGNTGRYRRFYALGGPELYVAYLAADAAPNVTGEYWVVRTADGTTYQFGYQEDAEQVVGPVSAFHNSTQWRNDAYAAASWKLDTVTDVNGRQIRYTYLEKCGEQLGTSGCRNVGPFETEVDTAVNQIQYNFSSGVPQTTITFGYFGRNIDPMRRDKNMTVGHYRPDRLIIQQAGQTVGAYTFAYEEYNHTILDSGDQYSVNFWWLTSITPYGNDYVYSPTPPNHSGTKLPIQTFTYSQETKGCHTNPGSSQPTCAKLLDKVDNGYGGVTRFVYQSYTSNGQPITGGEWFVVKEVYAWDGVRHDFAASEVAMTRLVYDRSSYAACYERVNTGCDAPSQENSNALVGFSGVTVDTQTYNGSTWATLSRSQEEFDVSNYWLNGKTKAQRALDPTATPATKLTEELFTWDAAGTYGTDPQLTQVDHYLYAEATLHTYEKFSYYSDFGGLYRQEEYRMDTGGPTLYRCTEHAYTHQTTGPIWLVNHPVRQTLYSGSCGTPKIAETLYRYDDPTSPADTTLDGKAALAWALAWQGGSSYVSTQTLYYTSGPHVGLPYQTLTYNDTSTTTAFAGSVRNTSAILGYTPLGLPTSTQASGSGVTTQTTSVTYDGLFAWLPAAVTDANNDTTSYAYDKFGRLTKVIRPGDNSSNPTIRYSYWDDPTLAEGTLFLKPLLMETTYKGTLVQGQSTRQFYDGLGRLVQAQSPRADVRHGSSDFGERDVITTTAYDARGLLTCQTTPYDVPKYIWPDPPTTPYRDDACTAYAHTAHQYDVLGRVTKTTAPDNTTSIHQYGVFDKVNAIGTYQEIIDPNRHRTQQVYDAWGRMIKVIEFSGDCEISRSSEFECSGNYITPWAIYSTTIYNFNRLDQLIEVIDNAGNDTDMTYDPLGRKLTMDDPDMGYWTYTYDAAGNLMTQTDAKMQTLTFSYDSFNRLTSKAAGPAGLATYTYDETAGGNNGIGRLTKVDDTSGSHTFVYDNRGRLTSESRVITGQPTAFTMQYAYDPLDRLTSQTYPNGETVATAYNNQGLPESLTGTNAYVNAVQYNRLGQTKILDLGNGLKTYYGYNGYEGFGHNDIYDARNVTQTGWEDWYGNLWRICTAPDASTRCQEANKDQPLADQRLDLRHSFDAAGNIDAIRDYVNSNQVQYFSYDHRNRLTSARTDIFGYDHSYFYDELGNIKSRVENVNPVVITYGYGYRSTKPHAVTSFSGGFINSPYYAIFMYDANGNMTHRTDGNKTYNQQFDAENRLVQVAKSGTETCGGLVQEAEAGTRIGSFQEATDTNASSGKYVHAPNVGTIYTTPNENHKITYCFNVATAGTYKLKGWVYGANDNDDSFFVKVDGSPSNGYYWDIQNNTSYQEDELNNQNPPVTDPVSFYLAAGNHTIVVYLREDGTRLDKLALELQGTHTANVTTFTYDADGQRMKTVEPSGKTLYYPFPGYEVEVNGGVTMRRVTYSLGGQSIAQRELGLGLAESYDDGNSNGWTAHSGTWSIDSSFDYVYRQTNTSSSATNSSYALTQSGAMAYEWEAAFNSGASTAGLHLMASEAGSTNHGNSYLVWQDASLVRIYESINNTLYQRATASLSAGNGQKYQYRVTYTNGVITVYRDGAQVLSWTDTSPLTSGSYIALRTNQSDVSFDNIRVTGSPSSYNTLVYLHSNHLGSISAVTSSSGALQDQTLYYPFGDFRGSDPTFLTERGFTGHRHNNLGSNDLGLIYMNARFYVPGIGRFASADTIVPDPANPQAFNRYSYVLNSPLNFTDPSGHRVSDGCDYEGCATDADNWANNFINYIVENTDFSNVEDNPLGQFIVEQFLFNSYGLEEGLTAEQILVATIQERVRYVNHGMETWGKGSVSEVLELHRTWGNALEGAFLDALEGRGNYGGVGVPSRSSSSEPSVIPSRGTMAQYDCSFSADTPVMTEDGLVPISQVSLETLVLAFNEAAGEIGYYPVIAVWAHEDPVIVYLTIDGETVTTTPEHPFYTSEDEWVEAANLQPGDKIRNAAWDTGTVEAITFTTTPQTMYNFTVATAHTYFVGDNQWLVHNQCNDWAELSGMLRDASKRKGNFGVGQANREQIMAMGEAWVGPNYQVSRSNPNILISADGLRQFRPPTWKSWQGGTLQANLEWRVQPRGPWLGNAHVDVIP